MGNTLCHEHSVLVCRKICRSCRCSWCSASWQSPVWPSALPCCMGISPPGLGTPTCWGCSEMWLTAKAGRPDPSLSVCLSVCLSVRVCITCQHFELGIVTLGFDVLIQVVRATNAGCAGCVVKADSCICLKHVSPCLPACLSAQMSVCLSSCLLKCLSVCLSDPDSLPSPHSAC